MMKTRNSLLRILIEGVLAACVFAPEITLGGSFTTGSVEDVTPPQITVAASVTQIDGSGATISWMTSEVADSRVYFGATAPLVNLAGEIDYNLQHVVRLTKLDPNTTYQYQFVSVDPKGNTTTSSVLSFQTQSVQAQTITFGSPAPAPTYAPGGSFSISATSSSGLPVTYSSQTPGVCSVSGSTTPATVQIVAAGSCTVRAEQAGNSSYSAAAAIDQTIIIAKANQAFLTASTSPTSIHTGGTSQLSAMGGTTFGAISYQLISGPCAINGSVLTGNGQGLCGFTATMAGNGNYNDVTSALISVSVVSNVGASQTITFGSLPAPTYAPGGSFSISATSSSGLPVTYSSQTPGVCSVSGSTTPATVQIVAAGNCLIEANQFGNSNYSAAPSVTQAITIAKGNQLALNATATPDSILTGGTSQLSVSGGSTSGVVQYEVTSGACQISGNTLSGNGVGLCLVTATMSGNGNYNSVVSTAIPVSVISNQPPIPSPGGPVSATVGGGTLVTGSAAFTTPTNPPASQSFPYGVFTFSATTTVGGSITITLTYPQALPTGTRVMKQLNGTWVDWTGRTTIAGRVISFTLTDGAYGDTNPAAGVITDPIGPVIPNTPTPTPAPIPTLSEWAKISMMFLMILTVGWYGRRMKQR